MEPGAAPNLMVEPSTGAAFDLQPEISGWRYQTIGVGVRKMLLAPLYTIALAVERGQLAGLLGRVPARSDDPLGQRFLSALVDSPVDKAAHVGFHQDLPRERARDAIAEGLRRALGRRDEGRVERLAGLVRRDLARGDRVHWRSVANRVLVVELDGVHRIEAHLLARAVWVPYLGADPVSVSLKQRVLRTLTAKDRGPQLAG